MHLLLVESDPALCEELSKFLNREYGYQVDKALDLESALAWVCEAPTPYTIALIDDYLSPRPQHAPSLIGLELAEKVRTNSSNASLVLFSRVPVPRGRATWAKKIGVYSYIVKPYLIKQLGEVVKHAVENSRLRAAVRDREILQQMKILGDLYREISVSLDINAVWEQVCRSIVQIVHADHGGLVLFEPDQARGHVVAEYPENGARNLEIPLRGIPLEEALIQTQQPQCLINVRQARNLGPVQDILLNLHIDSILIVPIVVKGEVIGSLSLDAIGHSREFSPEEIDLCKFFAAHISPAIENARLYSETRDRADELQRLQAQLAIQKDSLARSVKAAQQLARTMVVGELKGTLSAVAEGMREASQCDIVMLYRYDSATRCLDYPPVFMEGLYHPEEIGRKLELLQDSIVYEMLNLDGKKVIPDVDNVAWWGKRRPRPVTAPGVANSGANPLVSRPFLRASGTCIIVEGEHPTDSGTSQ